MPDEPERSPADEPTVHLPARVAATAGVLAAGLTLGVAHLLAAVLAPAASPLLAVGGVAVDATPAWLKDVAIAAFGVHDKTALFVGMAMVLGGAAAGIGLLARTRPAVATWCVLGLGALGVAAATARGDAGPLAALPSALGALLGAGALRGMLTRARPPVLAPPVAGGLDRRGFLTAAALVTTAAALSAGVGVTVDRLGRAATAVRDRVRLPRPRRTAVPIPHGARAPVVGVVPFRTPNADFFRIDTALSVPRVDPTTWRLRVHGMVEREVELTFDELLGADLVEAHVTLACVSNPVGGDLIGTATWLGLPVREVLVRAGPSPEADMVLSTSTDGFTASTPIEVLTDERDALLAVGMNGEPLPMSHGFPVRMVVPGLYGFVSATKWLVDLEVTTFARQEAYWTARGWSERGPVKTSSRIEAPRPGVTLPAGPVAVGGTAWAQHTGISAVHVQVDDGPWVAAQLADEVTVDTWRQWSYTWDAEPGDHVLRARAVDASGATQTAREAPVVPDGATGLHTIEVRVAT